MEESMRKKLANGFLICKLGIGVFYGMIFVAAAFIARIVMFGDKIGTFPITMVAMFVVGIVAFAVGRTIVGLQSRKLNLFMDRPRTDEEEWFLQEMLGTEDEAMRMNLANRAGALTPGKLDDFVLGTMAGGLVSHFMKVGKVYMPKNFLLKNCTLIISIVAAAILVIVKMV